MTRLSPPFESMPEESGFGATTVTSSTKVPDGHSGPVAVNVESPVAKLICSVMVKGTGSAAWAAVAAPSGMSRPSARAPSFMKRRIVTSERFEPGVWGRFRRSTVRAHAGLDAGPIYLAHSPDRPQPDKPALFSQHGTAGSGPHLRGSPTLSGRSHHTEGAGRAQCLASCPDPSRSGRPQGHDLGRDLGF